jgi:hypothetical protein
VAFGLNFSLQIGSATQFENPILSAQLRLHAFGILVCGLLCLRTCQFAKEIAFILATDVVGSLMRFAHCRDFANWFSGLFRQLELDLFRSSHSKAR